MIWYSTVYVCLPVMEVNVVDATTEVMDVAFPAAGQSLVKWQGNSMKLPGRAIKDLATTGELGLTYIPF